MRRAAFLALPGAPIALLVAALLALGACGGSDETPTAPPPREVRVPDVVGMRFGAAVRTLERAGLEQRAPAFPGTVGNPAYGVRCTAVDSEAPRPGTRVAVGSTVAIVYGACKHSISAAGGRSSGG